MHFSSTIEGCGPEQGGHHEERDGRRQPRGDLYVQSDGDEGGAGQRRGEPVIKKIVISNEPRSITGRMRNPLNVKWISHYVRNDTSTPIFYCFDLWIF